LAGINKPAPTEKTLRSTDTNRQLLRAAKGAAPRPAAKTIVDVEGGDQ
jgi:hypothetical protein